MTLSLSPSTTVRLCHPPDQAVPTPAIYIYIYGSAAEHGKENLEKMEDDNSTGDDVWSMVDVFHTPSYGNVSFVPIEPSHEYVHPQHTHTLVHTRTTQRSVSIQFK
jgi:hypothetical protein